MLFNTFAYWLFFGVVIALYYALPMRRRWPLLLVASYGFYGAWSPPYLLLLALSTVIDWQAAMGIRRAERAWKRKAWLGVSLTANLGLLATYKYADFFLGSFEHALRWSGVELTLPRLDLVLPVGISFYTFQTLSYTIDVYRGQLEPERNLARVALYVSFFPQLVAGPIERASHLLPQLQAGVFAAKPDAIASGLRLALFGIFKKVVVADRLAVYVDAVYADPSAHTAPTLLLATYAFAFQIYADFSGYSDVAIGCARALGFDLRPNFDTPYVSRSIREFWRRWHVSLSFWLRDYLYVPLGGSQGSQAKTVRNLFVTMILGGLWHGAAWTFVVWGALQGALLAASHLFGGRSKESAPWRRALDVAITFHLVCLGWVFFRANDLGDAFAVLGGLLRPGALFADAHTLAHGFVGVAVMLFVEHGLAGRFRLRVPSFGRALASAALFFGIVLLGVEEGSQFIYFQF